MDWESSVLHRIDRDLIGDGHVLVEELESGVWEVKVRVLKQRVRRRSRLLLLLLRRRPAASAAGGAEARWLPVHVGRERATEKR